MTRPSRVWIPRLALAFALALSSNAARAEFRTAAVFSDPRAAEGAQIVVEPWMLPDVPPPGRYRVKMIRSQICNSDRRGMAGTKQAELLKKKIVLGHEAIGRIYRLPRSARDEALKLGDLVVVLPHYVDKNDPMLAKGLPNLSPAMKHLGIHLDGVFADYMDFPAYNLYPIPDSAKVLAEIKDQEAYYDQMTMIEPLACVQRGYKLLGKEDYFDPRRFKTALVLGAGPMGVMHAVHLQKQHPELLVDIYDNDPRRRELARGVKNLKTRVLEQLNSPRAYDLVTVATSDRQANTRDAIALVRDGGVIVLFSGIDLEAGEAHPHVGALDIEDVHRHEGSVKLMHFEVNGRPKTINFLGTSGYVKDDVASAIRELHQDLLLRDRSVYPGLATTVIPSLTSRTARDRTGKFHDSTFDQPAIIPLLRLYDTHMQRDANVHNHLKILILHR